MTAAETVHEYFDALVAEDGDRLTALMARAPHFTKIGTDEGEWVEGCDRIAEYFAGGAASTEGLRIDTRRLRIEEREGVAWFRALQAWRLTWSGRDETLQMRLTGVLERVDGAWRFVQIHASVGES